MKLIGTGLLLAILALGLSGMALNHVSASSKLPEQANDSEVIEMTLPDLNGQPVSFSEFRGQWLVVNYWATWCAPCREEIPALSELHDQRDDVTVLGLAFEDATVELLESFLEDFPATYPILQVDVYAPPEPFGAPRGLPTTIVLNPQGRMHKRFVGPTTRAQLEDVIAAPADIASKSESEESIDG